ncbi:kinase and PP2C-like domain-containing [Chlorella sorokiniana]|uniref:Kinase and PP2C-like domain-containing n=1 Tax=Chlorella sorokiniana TaxID=3076 RepID=A0A2P6TY24_CHLSO|nr:kinase and PP2C-like domain-containing [Chlorella sorokiniana]|eukprot:PRW58969.1 kinase and PP2C-like domain-containing [Chlorella sorokiniana]
MAAAVQCGDFAAAEAAGAAAPANLALPRGCLSGLQPISEGAQASVYAAQLAPARLVATTEGSSSGLKAAEAQGSLAVAVKKPRIRETADLERFRREVALLAQLRHPHIVRLLGARLLPPDYLAVLALEHTNAAAELHSAGWRPRWPAVLSLGAQLAAAVAHIHAAGYVHRDIKPANLLLDEQRSTARLADLGLAAPAEELASGGVAHAKPTGGFHKQHMVGTLEYMAPEVLLGAPGSFASDVFALAVTLNELATGIAPYSDCTRDNPLAHTVLEMGYGRQELAAAVAAEGLRPTLHPGTPPALAALLQACWERQPEARPAAAAVAEQLAAVAAEAAAAEAAASPAGASPPAVPTPALAAGRLLPSPQRPLWHGGVAEAGDEEMVDAAEADCAGGSPSSSCAAGLGGGSPTAVASPASSSPSSSATGSLPCWLAGSPQQQQLGAAQQRTEKQPTPQQQRQELAVGQFLTPGRRDAMEDAVVVLHDVCAAAGAPGCTAVGVFDGHRGAAAADYLTAHMQRHLAQRLGSSDSAPAALAGALADADAAFRAEQDAAWAARLARMGAAAAGPCPAPGATATLLLLYPAGQGGEQMLAVANLGDSRAVLCREGQAVPLTRDHTADCPAERARVAAEGGACSVRAGSWRVGDAGLQVTRSIGDADLKAQGVSAEAETAELALQPGDAFVVVATDGLWDRVSNEEAVALVQDTVKHPGMCAQRLAVEALARGGGDNVAVVVMFLPGHGTTAERVYHAGQLKYHGTGAAKRSAGPGMSADELRDTAPAASRRATGRSRPLRVLAQREAHAHGFASNILTMQAPLLEQFGGSWEAEKARAEARELQLMLDEVNRSLAVEREAKKAAEKDRALVQIVLDAKQRLADAMREEAAAAAKALAAERAISAETQELQDKLSELNRSLMSEREARAAVESEKRLVLIELEAKQARLADMMTAAQRQAEEAVAIREEANGRYSELMEQLHAERDARAALEKQMDEAATQLAAANNRYQEALVLLHSERSKAATLERDASEAKSMLATANIRYAELTDRLDEEKKRAALLEREKEDAARERADANARVQALLAELQAERANSAGLEHQAEEARRLLDDAKSRYQMVQERLVAEGRTTEELERERGAAAAQLAEAKARINEVLDQLSAERSQTAALKAQAAEAAQQLAEANSRYRTALEQLQAERARADALQAERDAVVAELAEARSRYSWALAELEAERARSSMLEARADEAAAELAGVKERYREVLEKLEAELDHSASLEEQVQTAAAQLAEANARYNQLQAERDSHGGMVQRHIDDAAVELADANTRYQQLKQQLQDEQVQRALLQRQADEVSASARAERVEAQARYQELLAQLTAERDQREALQNELAAAQEELASSYLEVEHLQEELRSTNATVKSLFADVHSIKNKVFQERQERAAAAAAPPSVPSVLQSLDHATLTSLHAGEMELEQLLAAAHDELLAAAELEAAELAAAQDKLWHLQERYGVLEHQAAVAQAAVAERESQVADLQRQLQVAQAAASEAAGNDAKLKRQAQTVAELAAAKSKLVTTESRLAKLQDRHAALQKQYQEAQRTAAEWEAAGVRRQEQTEAELEETRERLAAAEALSAETAELRSKLRKAQEATSNEKQLRLALEQQRVALEQQRHAMEQQLAAADSARRQAEAALEAARKEAAAAAAAARAAQPDLPGLAPKPILPKALQAFAKFVGAEDPSAHSQHATASMDGSDSEAESDTEGGAEGASVGTPLGATAALRGAKSFSRRRKSKGKLRALGDEEQ